MTRIRSDVDRDELVIKRKGWYIPLAKASKDEALMRPVGYLDGDFFYIIGFITGVEDDP